MLVESWMQLSVPSTPPESTYCVQPNGHCAAISDANISNAQHLTRRDAGDPALRPPRPIEQNWRLQTPFKLWLACANRLQGWTSQRHPLATTRAVKRIIPVKDAVKQHHGVLTTGHEWCLSSACHQRKALEHIHQSSFRRIHASVWFLA